MKVRNKFCRLLILVFTLSPVYSYSQTKPAFMVSEITYLDKEKYVNLYAPEAKKAFADHEAIFIASTDEKVVVRGDSPGHRVVIAKFPSIEKATAFIASDKYKKLREIGAPFFISRVYIIEGN